MDHLYRRIIDFIKYRPNVNPIVFGDFIVDAVKDPEKYKQGFWAVNCAIDQFPAYTLAGVVKKYDLHSTCAFMTADHEIVEKYRDLNFRYFPYCIAEGIAQVKTVNELENPEITFSTRTNVLSFVNRFARFHRLYAFYRLCQKPTLAANAAVGFTKLETKFPDQHGRLIPTDLSLEEMLDVARLHDFYSNEFETWLSREYGNLPRQIEQYDNIDNKYDNWVKSQAFSESYCNIVTETYVEDFLPTEKVVKPLLAGCLFMPISSKGYMQKLERMGFDLKFDGIDYTLYDDLPTWQQRADKVIDLADELYSRIREIWHANVDRLKHNRNLFFSQQLEQHVLHDIGDIFDINY